MRLDLADASLDDFEVVLQFQAVELKAIEGAGEFGDEGRSEEGFGFGTHGWRRWSFGRRRGCRFGSGGLLGR